MVVGIVGVGHLAALQRKTWLLREFADADNIDVRAGIELWAVLARPRRERCNSTVCARKYYADTVSRTTDNAECR